uniref:Uncharacterized protein n=1 Tax=Anopheles minimus TaxID=112268 RepID=A0A182W641_9DIPT
MTMWQSGGMGHGSQNNPWMKLMGIVHKERRHDNTQSQSGSNDRALNIRTFLTVPAGTSAVFYATKSVAHLQCGVDAKPQCVAAVAHAALTYGVMHGDVMHNWGGDSAEQGAGFVEILRPKSFAFGQIAKVNRTKAIVSNTI